MPPVDTELSQFNCEFCEFSNYSKSKVSNHLLTSHFCSISYNCTLCDFICGLRQIFFLHLHSHHRSSDDATDDYEEDFSVDYHRRETPLYQDDILPVELIKPHPDKIEELGQGSETKRSRQRKTRSSSSKSLFCSPTQKQSISNKTNTQGALVYHDRKFLGTLYTCVECNMKFKYLLSLKSHLKSHLTDRTLKGKVTRKIDSNATVASSKLRKKSKVKTKENRPVKDSSSNKVVRIFLFRNRKQKYRYKNQQRGEAKTRVKTADQSELKRNMHSHVKETLNTDTGGHNDKKSIENIPRSPHDKEHQDNEEGTGDFHYTQSEMMFLEVAKGLDRKATEFPCPHCPYIGKVFRNFKEHVMGHSEQRPFVCSSCCRSFVCKSKLVRHQRQVHNEDRPFLCAQCPYTAKSRSCLETHRLVMHPLEEHLRFSCPKCPARFARASMLKTHALRHNTGPHKLFSCPQCSFTTNYHRQFELHTTLHTGKHCLCSLCGRAYSGQAQLKVHMKVQHSDQSFQCSLCNFVTKRPEGLSKHMKSHSTERPYSCPHCDYKGKRKAHLTRHLSRHLNNDRAIDNRDELEKIHCQSCGKVFRSKDKLAQHLNTCSSACSGKSEKANGCRNKITIGTTSGINNDNASSSSAHVSYTSLVSKEPNSINHISMISSHGMSYRTETSSNYSTTNCTTNIQAIQLYTPSTISCGSESTIHHNQHLGKVQISNQLNQYQGKVNLSSATSAISSESVSSLSMSPLSKHNLPTLAPSFIHEHTVMATDNSATQELNNQFSVITSSGYRPLSSSEHPNTQAVNVFTQSQNTDPPSFTLSAPVATPPDSEIPFVATPSLINQQPSVAAPGTRQLITQGLGVAAPIPRPPTGHQHPYTTTPTVSLPAGFSQSGITLEEQSNQHQSVIAPVDSLATSSSAQIHVHQFIPLSSHPAKS